MHFVIISSACLYISFNSEVTALDKGLKEHWGAAIKNLRDVSEV